MTVTCQRGPCFVSASEVEVRIRNAGPIFQVLPPHGKELSETDSLNGSAKRGTGVRFILLPPTITTTKRITAFNQKVCKAWLESAALSCNGVVTPAITYDEAIGALRLDSLSPDLYPDGFFLSEAGLRTALDSLVAVALQEAVKQHLTEGGDERLHLSPATGGNKYFCPPHPVPDAILRGSCTCSPPSSHAFDAACRLLNRVWNGEESLEGAFDDVRERISRALGFQTPHHIVLHPSGTDAEFTALLVGAKTAKALGCTGIVNVVVGAGEVGSNTANAAGGRHFSKYMPNGGVESSEKLVYDFPEGTKVVQLRARQADGSMMPDFDQLVLNALEEAAASAQKPFFIVHAVDGSKVGSHITSRKLVGEVQARSGRRTLVVLDACQGRTEREEVDWYLARGAVVLITASKFYGAPGFCAMAVVPDSIASLLKHDDDAEVPSGIADYLTQFQVPSALKAIRTALPREPVNVGLLLRWTCGVAEMERFASVGPKAGEGIRRWVRGLQGLISLGYPNLELLPADDNSRDIGQVSQLGGVNSIISFKLLSGESKRRLGIAALRQIHQWMTTDVSSLLPVSASEAERKAVRVKCFIGQPVDLGSFEILRLAIGAALASDLGEDPTRLESALGDDAKVLDKMNVLVKYHGLMQRS
ncbi:hypothetical protein VTK56DRAFT_6015 [Thermocarpiscus australiensis]